MNKKTLQEVIRITQECLTRYWKMDPEYVISYFDDHVVWIGSLQSQFMEGRDAAAQDLRNSMRELKPCCLLKQEFLVVQNCGDACTIAGRYLVTTDESAEYFLQVQQRCTFTWEQTDERLRIKLIHVSNPMGELKVAEGESFVNTMGKMAYQYLMNHIRTLQDSRRLVITDKENYTYFLMPSEIVYAAADGRNCVLYTASGQEIFARMGIAEFMDASDERFISIHRSYVVNNAYISCVRKYEVVMQDGSRVPIPVKKYKEIRDYLMGQHSIKEE